MVGYANLDAINEYRQTDLFTSGKLALLSLPSKANINHLIISTVEEYILCIAALKESHVIPRLQELQVLVSKKLFELSYDNDQSRDIVLKNFGKELNAIKTETRDAAILKRIEKCREYLKSVDDLDTEYYHASVKCLEGTTEISKKIHQEYSQQVNGC